MIEIMTDEMVINFGFKNVQEFFKLVSDADLSTPEKQKDFKVWQNNDGSKEGLLKLNQTP